MQKLRSMTETIKMLSNENALLRSENEEIRDEMLADNNTPHPSLINNGVEGGKNDNDITINIVPKFDSERNRNVFNGFFSQVG